MTKKAVTSYMNLKVKQQNLLRNITNSTREKNRSQFKKKSFLPFLDFIESFLPSGSAQEKEGDQSIHFLKNNSLKYIFSDFYCIHAPYTIYEHRNPKFEIQNWI